MTDLAAVTHRLDDGGADDADPGRVGGKGAGLSFLARNGVAIPPAFAVTTAAFEAAVDRRLLAEIDEHVASLDAEAAVSDQERTAGEVRQVVLDATMPDAVLEGIADAYRELCERCGEEAVPVAVRSSALGEDASDRSFAGEYDTHLWVTGPADVADAVRRCWASLYTARAIAYRRRSEPAGQQRMAVVVQQMVDARAAGVFMTLNPVNGDRSKIVVEAIWGLGEPLVQGEVDPDRWVIDKVTGDVVTRSIATKTTRAVRDPDTGRGVVAVEVPPEQRDEPSLSDPELRAVVELARRVDRVAGRPQDGEFATIDGEPPDNVLALQVRPETVWSDRRREPVLGKRSAVGAIVEQLSRGAAIKEGSPDGDSG